MKKSWNKIWSKLEIIFSLENIISFGFAGIAAVSIFGTSFFLPDNNQVIIILTIVGLSIAYSSFFMSNAEILVEKDKIL